MPFCLSNNQESKFTFRKRAAFLTKFLMLLRLVTSLNNQSCSYYAYFVYLHLYLLISPRVGVRSRVSPPAYGEQHLHAGVAGTGGGLDAVEVAYYIQQRWRNVSSSHPTLIDAGIFKGIVGRRNYLCYNLLCAYSILYTINKPWLAATTIWRRLPGRWGSIAIRESERELETGTHVKALPGPIPAHLDLCCNCLLWETIHTVLFGI